MLNLSFRKQVLTGFITSLLLVFCVFYFSYNSITNLEKNEKAIDHTEAVIKTANTVQALLLDGETGQRGFIATGRTKFLEPYDRSAFQVPLAVLDLKALVKDNALQSQYADSVALYANLKTGELKSVLEIAYSRGLDSARRALSNASGKFDMDQVRLYVSRMTNEETRRLKIGKESSDAAATTTVNAIVVGAIIVVCIVMFLSYFIQKSFFKLKESEENIRLTNIELEKVLAENTAKNWLLTGTSRLNEKMQGQQSEKELAENVLTEICSYTHALTGTFYLYNEERNALELFASFAFHNENELKKSIKITDGWLGQTVASKKPAVIKGKLNDRLELASSLVHQNLTEIFIVPIFFEKKLIGIIEAAFYEELNESKKEYILMVADDIGIVLNTARSRSVMQNLLEQVQEQAEELTAQQEEMVLTNEELLSKTEMLQQSEEELKVQQEELRNSNAELEEKANLLEEKNRAIEEARESIDLKVKELEVTNKYKSEFLANMSHELRTPLNSILVLAQVLRDNKPANLSKDQVKYASVIINAGNDLLTLINDILDLSKIESGKMDVQNDTVRIADLLQDVDALFAGIAQKKKIKYKKTINKQLPKNIFTDKARVGQILKNLLSNAFKFTDENGSVTIDVVPGSNDKTVSFCVKDTGIGVPTDKQKAIFESFQQADGSTSRKYGGTGLGLPISKELAALLGGEITLNSEPGKGSEFSLTIPLTASPDLNKDSERMQPATDKPKNDSKPVTQVIKKDDREPLVIIVEDDKNFADILQDYCREYGYRSLVLHDGTTAVEAIRKNQPDAVILDIMLPGKDGWQLLTELKQAVETLHIPVHIMSAGEASASQARDGGAISFIKKPTDTGTLDKLFTEMIARNGNPVKQILLIEDDTTQSNVINELMKDRGITVDQAFDGESAYRMLNENEYQCIILDFNLPDISGLNLLDKIRENERLKNLPVIINTAMDLDKTSVNKLMRYANALVIKTSRSANRLIDEVNLFLNKINENTGGIKASTARKSALNAKDSSSVKGKKVLIVDDDIRNVFALTSALENYGMQVETANDGQEGIAKLQKTPGIDMVLMDIMMPNMDGNDAIKDIRGQNKWRTLPIIALTAKAMAGDREKCMAAGANDYITKPVDVDRLISLMQMWLV